MAPTDHDDAIKEIKRRRLAVLEEQQAFFGTDARPHIVMEIRELRRELSLPETTGVPDPPTPMPTVQPVLPTAVPDPGSPEEPASPPDERVPDLVERIKRQWLLAYAIAWLVFALLVMAALSEAFEPSQCVQRLGYALLALGGGLAILGFSLLPAYRPHYRLWDRLLTLLVTLAAAGLAGWLAYGRCLAPATQPLGPVS